MLPLLIRSQYYLGITTIKTMPLQISLNIQAISYLSTRIYTTVRWDVTWSYDLMYLMILCPSLLILGILLILGTLDLGHLLIVRLFLFILYTPSRLAYSFRYHTDCLINQRSGSTSIWKHVALDFKALCRLSLLSSLLSSLLCSLPSASLSLQRVSMGYSGWSTCNNGYTSMWYRYRISI